jgi:RHS repeat-associated protein
MDQLGSTGTSSSPGPSYFPWGEPRGTNPQDAWSYASYWTDSATGLDYANNRYYSNAYGRFMTPDPYQASGGPNDPQSWNRYAYTRGDPVNRYDPTGLMDSLTCGSGGYEEDEDGVEEECAVWQPDSCLLLIDGQVSPFCGNMQAGQFLQTFAGPTKIAVTGYSRTGAKENTITNDLNDILNQVLTGGCATWLTNEGVSGSQLINALETSVSGGPSYGYGTLSSNTTAAFVGTMNTDGTPISGLPGDSSITVNSNGAFFNSGYTVGSGNTQYNGGTLQAQIFILIHELAHLSGAAGFQSDAGNPSAVAKNNALVQKNCGSQIAGVH